MSPLIWLTASAALPIGFAVGWLLRGRGLTRNDQADWMTRIAARDRELHEVREDLADATLALQNAQTKSEESSEADSATADLARERARADAVTERLRATEAELADVRDLEMRVSSSGPPDLLRRIEELEVDLSAPASHRCPDPAAHPSTVLSPTPISGVDEQRETAAHGQKPIVEPSSVESGADTGSETDDLTRIAGIGNGLAKVLKSMGIATFEDLSGIDNEAVERLDQLVGGVRDRFERHDWPGAARDLQAEKAAAAP